MVLKILARIHCWYLWKVHFLNFRDIGALLEQLGSVIFNCCFNLAFVQEEGSGGVWRRGGREKDLL